MADSIFKYAPMAFRAWRRKDDLMTVANEWMPVIRMALATWKSTGPLIKDLLKDIGIADITSTGAAPGQIVAFDVEWIQSSLNKLMGTKLKLDGNPGDLTQEATKKFQQMLLDRKEPGWTDKDVDGFPGMKTIEALWHERRMRGIKD